MNKKTLPLIIASSITLIFYLLALFGSSAFNILPYYIYESISPGGANETVFIRVFDILFGVLLFWLVYKLSKALFK